MITLARHIELLLLDHDCVIVPGLGGFIANYANAEYSGDEESLLLPPYRTIGFNQQLQVNDGLLVQSYMMAYDTSYPFANLQMEKDLEKVMCELDMSGEYTLENIGTLKKSINHNITFVPFETGVLTPSLYGLYSCEMRSLNKVVKEKEVAEKLQLAASSMRIASEEKHEEEKVEKKKKHGDVVIHVNRHWLDFSISAAAAILLLFCFSYPALKNAGFESDTVVAAFTPMNDMTVKNTVITNKTKPAKKTRKAEIPKIKVAETYISENKEITLPEVKENFKFETKRSTKTETPKSVKAEAPKYALVLASYVSQKNAEDFIEKLAKEGFAEGQYVKNGKVSRILYSGYSSEEDAQKALAALRQQNAAFAEAWIIAL